MREVGSNARRVDDIIETKLEKFHVSEGLRSRVVEEVNNIGNLGICLEEKGQRLANTTLHPSQIGAMLEVGEYRPAAPRTTALTIVDLKRE